MVKTTKRLPIDIIRRERHMSSKGLRAARAAIRSKTKKPKLYRPPGSLSFPPVRGKTLADVYLTTEGDLNCVTLRFDDNTDLVIDIEPCLSFRADYSDLKTGNERIIKRWPHIRSAPTPSKKPSKRPLGLYRGEIWIAPDFDAPLMLVDDPEARRLVTDKEKRHRLRQKRGAAN